MKQIRLLNQEIQQDALDLCTKAVEDFQLAGGVIWKCLAKSGSGGLLLSWRALFLACKLWVAYRMERAGSISVVLLVGRPGGSDVFH